MSCLLDVVGSMSLSVEDQLRLLNGGVVLGWYNPISIEKFHLILHRDHTKLFAIDDQTLFIGGTGIADIFTPKVSPKTGLKQHWRENMFQISGPILIDCLDYLRQKWHSKNCVVSTDTNEYQNLEKLFSPSMPQIHVTPDHTRLHHAKGRWLTSKGGTQRRILKAIIKRIQHSQKNIILATAYFAPDPRLRRALKHAARRGVQVTLLLPGADADHTLIHKAGQYYYAPLLRAGITIFEYQKRFMHSKIVICDQFVCFGSSNLDVYTQRWSLEANIEIQSDQFSQQMLSILREDLKHSQSVKLEQWNRRSLVHKAISFLAYKAGLFLNFWAKQSFLYGQYRQVIARKKK